MDNEISFNEAMIDEREQGIKDIEEQIGQANEIFKDLAVLVHEQGVVIGKMPATLNMNYSCCYTQSFLLSFLLPPPRYKIVICFVITDDIHSNIESSSAATTQGRVQLAKASKSSKSKSSWVSSLNMTLY